MHNFIADAGVVYDEVTSFADRPEISRFHRLTEQQAAQARADRVPETILAYGLSLNGLKLDWATRTTPRFTGHIDLWPLEEIYGSDLRDILYFGLPEEDPRLPQYRPVDFYSNDISVGLLHDEQRSPELYYYNADATELYPTDLDLFGYCQLLHLSLGFNHWHCLLAQLGSSQGQQRPFQLLPYPQGALAQRVVAGLTQLVPTFTLEKFVRRYDELKLSVSTGYRRVE